MIEKLLPVRLTITREKISLYAAISRDFNPIHTDPVLAGRSAFGGIIAHGTLSMNMICEALEKTFGPPGDQIHALTVRFKLPVRENDILEASGDRCSDLAFNVWVRNQRGESVIEGTATIYSAADAGDPTSDARYPPRPPDNHQS
ncbi:MAG: MaoC family dehydratase [Dehalococcoidia bacterium]